LRYCDNCTRRHWRAKIDKRTGIQITHRNGHRVFLCIFCGHPQEEESPPLPIPERIKANILYIDIEVSKSVYYNYGKQVYGEYLNIKNLVKERYIMSWSASYIGQDQVWSECINSKEAKDWNDFTNSRTNSDERIIKKLHSLMNATDIIAGHNVNRFDIKHCFARFLYYDLPPIVNKKTIDTLLIARQKFKFEDNGLDYIAQRLGFRPKEAITNDDWNMALKGDKETLKRIQDYNIGDTVEGKRVLEKLTPWSGKKPHYGSLVGSREEQNAYEKQQDSDLQILLDELQELKDIV